MQASIVLIPEMKAKACRTKPKESSFLVKTKTRQKKKLERFSFSVETSLWE